MRFNYTVREEMIPEATHLVNAAERFCAGGCAGGAGACCWAGAGAVWATATPAPRPRAAREAANRRNFIRKSPVVERGRCGVPKAALGYPPHG